MMPLGPSFMFSVFPIFFIVIFALVVGTILFRVAQGARQWHRNSNSPVLTVTAKVVTKRMSVSSYAHHHGGDIHADMHHTTNSTAYYITFEFESGDRQEFVVDGTEYGYLVEGDMGRLTFQGTRYKGFERVYGESL